MNAIALDIGGANLKAAHRNDWALSVPFALWRAPDRLADELRSLIVAAPVCDTLRVTMTAELCDCFATKREGVGHILDAVEAVAEGRGIEVWLTTGRFVDAATARQRPIEVAAANWHALATWLARDVAPRGAALLIDVGSTTADIIPLRGGHVVAKGLNDHDRLRHSELLYTGGLRTALMALGPTVDFRGQHVPVMAEYFATTADVHVLRGDVAEDASAVDTADGRPRTVPHAAARVLRMVGGDLEMFTLADARALADAFAAVQVARLAEAVRTVAAREMPDTVIVSGSAAFLATRAAAAALPGVAQMPLAQRLTPAASVAACAHALLWL